MEQKICGVTGHREIPAEYMEQAEQDLRREIEKAIADGYTYFISGFADGADQLFARIVLEKAKENPALRLEAAIPYRNRYKRLMEDGQTRAMLEACAKVAVISEEWASNVYMKRNRYMVSQADRVIAVYDGREKGGTVSTIRMVHAQRKEMREVPVGPYLPKSMINLWISAFRTIEFVRPAVELRRVGMGVFQHALDAVFHLHLGKGTGTGTVVRRIEFPHLRVDLFGVGTGQPPERVQLVD